MGYAVRRRDFMHSSENPFASGLQLQKQLHVQSAPNVFTCTYIHMQHSFIYSLASCLSTLPPNRKRLQLHRSIIEGKQSFLLSSLSLSPSLPLLLPPVPPVPPVPLLFESNPCIVSVHFMYGIRRTK